MINQDTIETDLKLGYDAFNYRGLFDFVISSHPEYRVFIEIGCWKGFSTAYLAGISPDDSIIYAIDPWIENLAMTKIRWDQIKALYQDNYTQDTIYHIFLTHMKIAPGGNKVRHFRDYSYNVHHQFKDGSVDFLWIDGDHSYEGVKKDISLYLEKVKSGGIIGGHDFNVPSVRRAVIESGLKYHQFNNDYGTTISTSPDKSAGLSWWAYK